MSIPEDQLARWSNRGATDSAQRTHESIRAAIGAFSGWSHDWKSDIYLQGSYKNSTNIRGDSDVDVVVQTSAIFQPNVSSLSPEETTLYKAAFRDAATSWQDFHSDVLNALRSYYGSANVKQGSKSLKSKTPYLPADIVVAIEYRKYRRFCSLADQSYYEGMTFYVPAENRWIVNYPKLHYKNGCDKNSSTSDWFKPTVRVFKNARSYMADKGMLDKDIAPSYFVECLIYNAPDRLFCDSNHTTMTRTIGWFLGLDTDALGRLVCQNGVDQLFGNDSTQWSPGKAMSFIGAVISLYSKW